MLPKEIELAEPDVVVFFAGATNYDGRLRATFPEVRFTPDEAVRDFYLTELTGPFVRGSARWFRNEHPKPLQIQKQTKTVLDRIASLVGGSR